MGVTSRVHCTTHSPDRTQFMVSRAPRQPARIYQPRCVANSDAIACERIRTRILAASVVSEHDLGDVALGDRERGVA